MAVPSVFSPHFPGRVMACGLIGLSLLLILHSPPVHAEKVDEIVMAPMRDGVRLATRVVRPDESASAWPVVLCRTCYDELPWPLEDFYIFDYVDHGFVVVLQNFRGLFDSEGDNMPFLPDGWLEPKDGLATVDWILEQSWCDGQVFSTGKSARGIASNLIAGALDDPYKLVAQHVTRAPSSLYHGVAFTGGEFRYAMMIGFVLGTQYDNAALDMFVSHPLYDSFWADFDLTTRQQYRDCPVINKASWYDCFLNGVLDNYASIRESGGPIASEKSKLIITMEAHFVGMNQGCLPFPAIATEPPPEYTELQMLLHYGKGVANGFEELPRVAYYMMGDLENPDAPGNEWRYADDWPIPAATTVPLYLNSGGARGLSVTPPESGAEALSYDFDPTNPVPTMGGANLIYQYPGIELGNHDQRPVESRDDVLLFDSGPLPLPVSVVGPLEVVLYVSSDASDTDFTAKLSDVYPDGRSVLLCDGILRARNRNSLETEEFMSPGTIYELTVDLTATGNVFNAGHHIRLAVSSSNYPRFLVNPNTGGEFQLLTPPQLNETNSRVAHNTIYIDAEHPSHLLLPCVDADGDGNGVPDTLDCLCGGGGTQDVFTLVPSGGWYEEGSRVELVAETSSGLVGNVEYQWLKDGVAIPDADGPACVIESATLDDDGWYSLRVTDDSKNVYLTSPVWVRISDANALPLWGTWSGAACLAFIGLLGCAVLVRRARGAQRERG